MSRTFPVTASVPSDGTMLLRRGDLTVAEEQLVLRINGTVRLAAAPQDVRYAVLFPALLLVGPGGTEFRVVAGPRINQLKAALYYPWGHRAEMGALPGELQRSGVRPDPELWSSSRPLAARMWKMWMTLLAPLVALCGALVVVLAVLGPSISAGVADGGGEVSGYVRVLGIAAFLGGVLVAVAGVYRCMRWARWSLRLDAGISGTTPAPVPSWSRKMLTAGLCIVAAASAGGFLDRL